MAVCGNGDDEGDDDGDVHGLAITVTDYFFSVYACRLLLGTEQTNRRRNARLLDAQWFTEAKTKILRSYIGTSSSLECAISLHYYIYTFIFILVSFCLWALFLHCYHSRFWPTCLRTILNFVSVLEFDKNKNPSNNNIGLNVNCADLAIHTKHAINLILMNIWQQLWSHQEMMSHRFIRYYSVCMQFSNRSAKVKSSDWLD